MYLSDFGLTKRPASDSVITGLGCALFESLTGRPPFVSENDAGLTYAHLQQPLPSATAAKHALPGAIDRVLATAMAKALPDRCPAAGDGTDDRVIIGYPPENGRLVLDWSPDGRWIVMTTPYGMVGQGNVSAPNVCLTRSGGGELFLVGSGSKPPWRPVSG